ncbi:MAG: putative sulfate/molybdate transporter [Bryobacterales bacterium]|nr:putative sulfate/molybdate transporter [Bryobacterales bacterium]
MPESAEIQAPHPEPAHPQQAGRIRFSRQEWSGAFGDLGTDLPLIVGMILASGLSPSGVLTVFGLMQIATALRYRMPMPVQPLKAMAAIVIAQKIPASVLFGGGLAIGVCMLVLSATGLLSAIHRAVPKPVIRGIQLGLGLQLAGIALKDYVQADGVHGLWLAGIGFTVALVLIGRKHIPSAVVLVAMGAAYAFLFKLHAGALTEATGFQFPQWQAPTGADIWTGFLLLALPQIPLSIANSVLATTQLAEDLFPQRKITIRQIGLTYSLMNLVNPFFGGIPTCHGSGGMAGHYTFGGRTGGSVVIYGIIFVVLGLFFSQGFQTVIQVFPLPMLGVLLLFEAIALVVLSRDLGKNPPHFVLAIVVGLLASSLPYGYLIGLLTGVATYHLMQKRWSRLGLPPE